MRWTEVLVFEGGRGNGSRTLDRCMKCSLFLSPIFLSFFLSLLISLLVSHAFSPTSDAWDPRPTGGVIKGSTSGRCGRPKARTEGLARRFETNSEEIRA